MRTAAERAFKVVGKTEPPLDLASDIYAEARAAALDSDRWRRLHERSDQSTAINLGRTVRRLFNMGGGTRSERGGFKFEERL